MDANTPSSEELDGVDPKVYHRRWLILATMCLSLLMISVAISSVNVAIPTISRSELRPTATQVVWIVDAYALAFAALLLPAGAIGDRFGRKGTMLAGLVVFAAASVGCAYMTSTTALIAARAVMGAGAALIMPSTLSLLQSSFPRRERARAFAVWAAVAGAAGGVGPLTGGLLVEHFWYGSVFFASVPFAAVALVAAAVLAPSARDSVRHRFDLGGAALSIVGLAALLTAIIEGPERGWGDPVVVGAAALAAVVLLAFVQFERRRHEPMLDMAFFRDPRFAVGAFGILLEFFDHAGADYACNHLDRLGSGYADGFGAEVLSEPLLDRLAATCTDPRHREHVTLALWDDPAAHRLAAVPAPAALAFPDLRFDVDRPEDLADLAALVARAGLQMASPAADVVAAAQACASAGNTANSGLLRGLPAQAVA